MAGKNKSLILGIRVVMEAIHAGKEIDKVLINKSNSSPLKQELIALMKEKGIVSQHVPEQKLNRISNRNHQGVIAFLSPITYQRVDQIIPNLYDAGKSPFILILDGITDVRNLGAIARTAECAGVHAIVVPEKGSAGINEDAVKISAGALLKIPVCREKDLLEAVEFIKNSGIRIVAATEKEKSDIHTVQLEQGPVALVMGAEDKGVSSEILSLADDRLKIPMFGEIASLNVSVSAGILLYELVKVNSSK